MANFLKKYLVLILCGALVLGALGVGVWYVCNPADETPDNQSQETGDSTTESTGDLDSDLDIDIGFGDMDDQGGTGALPGGDDVIIIDPDNQSGITNVPGDDSGNITPVTPDDNTDETTDSSTDEAAGSVDMTGGVVNNPFN